MEYTREQLTAQIQAMQPMFDDVVLVDPSAGQKLDPVTLQPTGPAREVPRLDERGRAWEPLFEDDDISLVLYWSVRPDGRPLVLAGTYRLPHVDAGGTREANAFTRMMAQCREELCHDYVTGVYNRAYLDAAFRGRITAAASSGKPVSIALVGINEYATLCRTESTAAADRCLNTAAGILGLALNGEKEDNTLVRLEDGVFLAVSVGSSAGALAARLEDPLRNARRNFSITLARRGEFSATVVSADWGEAGSWDLLLGLAEQRLNGG